MFIYSLDTNFKNSHIPIISNFSAKISNNNEEIIESLIKQMSKRVRWVESINVLDDINEKNIIEIGPGKVLTGLIKRINNNFDIINIEKIFDIEKIKNEI